MKTQYARVAVADLKEEDGAINFAKIFSLVPDRSSSTENLNLMKIGDADEALTIGAMFPGIADVQPSAFLMESLIAENSIPQLAKAALPKLQSVEVEAVSGTLLNRGTTPQFETEGVAETIVPVGVRYVSALTLKLMLGKAGNDTLLERKADKWQVVDNNERIDLKGRTEYKIGRIQLYS